jgi:hypothetical protein
MNVSQSKFRPLAFLAAVGLAAVLISAVVAVDADAARGARGGGRDSGGTATLTVSPDPVLAGTQYTVTGSGFSANAPIYFNVSDPSCCYFFTIWSDANGGVTFDFLRAGNPGTYQIDASERGNNGKLSLKGSVTFGVQ